MIVFLFLSFLGISQTSMEGILTDAKTGEPIITGKITMFKNDILILETETDLRGYYIFSNINPGTYSFKVSHIDYKGQHKTEIIIRAKQLNKLDFSLYQVILTSSGFPIYDAESLLTKPTSSYISSHYINKTTSAMTSIGASNKSGYYSDLDKSDILLGSGQITAGEWNDLHNWKDWMSLLEDEEYSIMTERFEIYPTQRYSVIVINEKKSVIPNVPVKLLDDNNNIIWETVTDNSGKAELWSQPFINEEDNRTYQIIVDGKITANPKTINQGSNNIVLNQDCNSPTKMDIVFTVDATSSMNDEIQFLKTELLDVIDRIQETNKKIEYRTGSIFYRDTRDDYLTRISPLSSENSELIDFVTIQNASGGGDKPEAVEVALEETLNLDWNKEAIKLVFLILDAPPHEDEVTMTKIRSQIKTAAAKGIKLIPITASGIGRETEFLMKFMAMMTNGTYIFITDDSGIGEAHLAPVVKDYEVEKLNDCMVRLISQYSKSYSCDIEDFSEGDININIYPNPSTQYINVETETIANKINILSSNGMIIKSTTPSQKTTRIELEDLVNGVYTVVINLEETTVSKQIILLK